MADEYGVGSLSGQGVPRSQQRAALVHVKGEEQRLIRKLNKTFNYADRRRAEQDLEGVQATKHKILSWDVRD